MTTIPGASRYLSASIYANQTGQSVAQASILDGSGTTQSLLDVGRSIFSDTGIGISQGARELNQQFMNRSADVNELFSLSGGGSASIEAAQIQIKGLRAKFGIAEDTGGVAASSNGRTVNTEA